MWNSSWQTGLRRKGTEVAKTAGGIRSNGDKSISAQAKEKILSVFSDIKQQGFSRISPFKIGSVEKRMKEFARQNGIELGSKDLYMSSAAIAHATRDSKKAKGLTVSEMDLASFPSKRKKMDLYYDSRTGNFTYANGRVKYIVHPNYSIKMPGGKQKLVNFITASKIEDKREFGMGVYKKIR